MRQEEEGTRVSTVDITTYLQVIPFELIHESSNKIQSTSPKILNFDPKVTCVCFLQNELECEPEETAMPFPMQEFHQHQFAPPNVNTSAAAHHVPSSHIAQHYDCNQEKVLIPPNGLSSPVRRTLQEFNLCEAASGNHNHPHSTRP